MDLSYSIVINNSLTDTFKPSRGLRQGDPFSLYLFLICTEGLSAVLTKLQRDGMINGTQAKRHGPIVTHIFFANDSLLFAKANRRESERVKNVLQLYKECFGQKINFDKSALFFSSNTHDETKVELKELFGVEATMNLEKYLGLPTMVGKNKRYAFREIKSRISTRLNR